MNILPSFLAPRAVAPLIADLKVARALLEEATRPGQAPPDEPPTPTPGGPQPGKDGEDPEHLRFEEVNGEQQRCPAWMRVASAFAKSGHGMKDIPGWKATFLIASASCRVATRKGDDPSKDHRVPGGDDDDSDQSSPQPGKDPQDDEH